MSYAIYHCEKGGSTPGALGHHIDRTPGQEHTYRHADKSRIDKNVNFTPEKFKNLPLHEAINLRIKEGYKSNKAIRKDAVKFVTHVLTGTHEGINEIFRQKKAKDWVNAAYAWAQKEFGKDNIVRFVVHLDEKTPHIHMVTVPLTADGRLSAKEVLGNPIEMRNRQTRFAEAMKPFGLSRGLEGSTAKHEDIKEYYKRVDAAEKDKKSLSKELSEILDKEDLSILNFRSFKSRVSDKIDTRIKEHQTDKNRPIVNAISTNNQTLNRLSKIVSYEREANLTLRINSIPIYEVARYLANRGSIFEDRQIGNENYFKRDLSQKTGSIAVNSRKNVYYDFSNNKFGSVIDFVMDVQKMNFSEAKEFLKANFLDKTPEETKDLDKIDLYNKTINKDFEITNVNNIVNNTLLLQYSQNRGISKEVLDKSLVKELYFKKGDKKYFSLGLLCPLGYVMRNESFKGNIGKIEPVIDIQDKNSVIVVEGMFDYLSIREAEKAESDALKSYKQAKIPPPDSVLILNSTSNIQKAIEQIKSLGFKQVCHALDTDQSGREAAQEIEKAFPGSIDLTKRYEIKGDLNSDIQNLKSKYTQPERLAKFLPKNIIQKGRDFGFER